MELKLKAQGEACKLKKDKNINNRQYISTKALINLIKRYLNEVGGEITGTTVFEGVCIGERIIEIRSRYKSGRRNLLEEDIKELEALGLLDSINIQGFSLKEKIELFKRYLEKYGEENTELNGATMFEGYPIGFMLIQIRSKIKRGKHNFLEEDIKELEALGLLKNINDNIRDKVERFEKFCYENPKVWKNRKKVLADFENGTISPEFMISESTIEELRRLVRDYEYVKARREKGKLKPEYFERLKEAGVGGVFGHKREVEELSKNTGIDIEILEQIIEEFGILNTFRKIYINYMAEYYKYFLESGELNESYIIENFGSLEKYNIFMAIYNKLAKNGQVVTCFDLEKPGFLADSKGRRLAHIIEGEYVPGYFFDKNEYKIAQLRLSAKEVSVLEDLVGEDGQGLLDKDIAVKLKLTRSRIGQIKVEAAKKVRNSYKKRTFNISINQEKRAEFIRCYFEEKDIFVTSESFVLSEKLEGELLQIVEEASVTRKEFLELEQQQELKALQEKKLHKKRLRIYRYNFEKAGFSEQTCIALEKCGCFNIGDIIRKIKTPQDLLNIEDCGAESIAEIVSIVHLYGLKFDFESEDKREKQKDKYLKELISKLRTTYQEYEEIVQRCEKIKEVSWTEKQKRTRARSIKEFISSMSEK